VSRLRLDGESGRHSLKDVDVQFETAQIETTVYAIVIAERAQASGRRCENSTERDAIESYPATLRV
jgi:hypothetical protein